MKSLQSLTFEPYHKAAQLRRTTEKAALRHYTLFVFGWSRAWQFCTLHPLDSSGRPPNSFRNSQKTPRKHKKTSKGLGYGVCFWGNPREEMPVMPESRLRLQPSFPELASKEKTLVHTLCVQRSSRMPYTLPGVVEVRTSLSCPFAQHHFCIPGCRISKEKVSVSAWYTSHQLPARQTPAAR